MVVLYGQSPSIKIKPFREARDYGFFRKIEVWGYFELSLVYFVLDNLETKTLIRIMDVFEKKNCNYLKIFKYRRRIFQIAYRAVVVFISRGEQEQARLILNKTVQRYPDTIDFYSESLRQMALGIYRYNFENSVEGRREILEVFETFERLGSKALRTFYEKRTQLVLQNRL